MRLCVPRTKSSGGWESEELPARHHNRRLPYEKEVFGRPGAVAKISKSGRKKDDLGHLRGEKAIEGTETCEAPGGFWRGGDFARSAPD